MLHTVPDLTTSHYLNVRLTAVMSLVAIHTPMNAWRFAQRQFNDYATSWATFKEAALNTSEARLLVDGEKSVTKFLAFRSVKDLDCRLIHLTRDPRAFVQSVRSNRARAGLKSKTLAESASSWTKSHRRILRASSGLKPSRYRLVRYEDLAQRPVETMRGVFEFMGLPDADVAHPPQQAHVIGNDRAMIELP